MKADTQTVKILLGMGCLIIFALGGWVYASAEPGSIGPAGAKIDRLPPDVRAMLKQPDQVWLYSIYPEARSLNEKLLASSQAARETDPKYKKNIREVVARQEVFCEYPVGGKCQLKDKASQKELVDALFKGIDQWDGHRASCFDPHHGLRVIKGKDKVDLVVCFECADIHIYKNDQLLRAGSGTDGTPEKVFDKILVSNGAKLTKTEAGN